MQRQHVELAMCLNFTREAHRLVDGIIAMAVHMHTCKACSFGAKADIMRNHLDSLFGHSFAG